MVTAGTAVGQLLAHNPTYAKKSFLALPPHSSQMLADSPPFKEIDESIHDFAFPMNMIYPKSLQLTENLFIFKMKTDYLITNFVGRGADGAVYEGYNPKNPQKRLIFKFYIGAFYSFLGYDTLKSIFLTEVRTLEKLNRLVDADYGNLVTVQPKIEGIPLQEHLDNLLATDEIQYIETIKQYLALPKQFREKWNIIHGDVRPANVIVDLAGKMHLIDFGRSRSISSDKAKRDHEEQVDDDIARKAINHPYQWSSFSLVNEWRDL